MDRLVGGQYQQWNVIWFGLVNIDKFAKFAKFQTLVQPISKKKIQLIRTEKSPVLAILNFHSTCIMNFITNSTAYSLYPFSTYCRKTSLVCGTNKTPTMTTIEKYEKHGWSPEFAYTDEELMTNATASECKKNIRRIGDTNCWVHHDTTQKFATYEESIEWMIQYHRDYMEITDDGEVITAGFYYPVTHIEREK